MKDFDPKKLTEFDLKEWLTDIHEKYYIELKKASELPRSFWDSYSSFCNTSGGWIVLGVDEGYPKNQIIGVDNPKKTLTFLWDQASNTSKVSFRNIDNDDVSEYTIDGKSVIIVRVKEAADIHKPVYLNEKIENAYIRTGDGDRKINKDELAAFLRNAQPGHDNLSAGNFTIEDLDLDSVLTFKERVSKRFPKKKFMELSHIDFLTEIGGCYKDRDTGDIRIKRGTVLFLGKCNSIKELYPHYHVDFFNRRGNNFRWIDRISDDEPGDYEMNLYNFYNIVNEKIKLLLKESFVLDEKQIRIPVSDFDETIRECLVNCIAHADYEQGYPSTKIDVYDGWFHFINPGKMLISPEQFVIGGDSRPRNEIIMSFFRLLGASERQGFGGPLIYKNAKQNDFRHPEIVTDLEHTELKVWNIDLADAYPELGVNEKNILRYLTKNGLSASVNDLKNGLNISEYAVRQALPILEKKDLVEKFGNGSARKYRIVLDETSLVTQLQMFMEAIKKNMVGLSK